MKIIMVPTCYVCCSILYLEDIDACCVIVRIGTETKEWLIALLSVKHMWHVVAL